MGGAGGGMFMGFRAMGGLGRTTGEGAGVEGLDLLNIAILSRSALGLAAGAGGPLVGVEAEEGSWELGGTSWATEMIGSVGRFGGKLDSWEEDGMRQMEMLAGAFGVGFWTAAEAAGSG